jgi:hypothetical protein
MIDTGMSHIGFRCIVRIAGTPEKEGETVLEKEAQTVLEKEGETVLEKEAQTAREQTKQPLANCSAHAIEATQISGVLDLAVQLRGQLREDLGRNLK